MIPISVIIITKNEAKNIHLCISAARMVSNDIIIVDSGSTDDTINLVLKEEVTLIQVPWESYGISRNNGAAAAKFDWILSLDADEIITDSFCQTMKNFRFSNPHVSYRIKRKNFLQDKEIRFGAVGFDAPVRIYNKKNAYWDTAPIHEQLIYRVKKIKMLRGVFLHHYTFQSFKQYKGKLDLYAHLCALKYKQLGKHPTWTKLYVAPYFNALKSFLFQLGFLEGVIGLKFALLIFYYTEKKYKLLANLYEEEKEIKVVALPAARKLA